MTEFKQIVGRGTRVHEDTKKFYFTLIDFREATNHFADPDFDGEPVQIYEPGEDDPIAPPDDAPPPEDDEAPIPPEPAEDETIVDGEPPDIAIQTSGDERERRSTSTASQCHDRRRARRVPRRARQAGHREPARLHAEGARRSGSPASTSS